MSKPDDRETRLEQFLKLMRLQPTQVVAEAKRVARSLGLSEAISRQHFIRLRAGSSGATEEKIRLLVTTFRRMTGMHVRATDLFDLEPAVPGLGFSAVALRDSTRRLSLFSTARGTAPWSFLVDQNRPSAAETLEVLYREHAALLRTNARRRFRIPEDDIEALVHDVFASFLERQPRVDDVRAYLIGATNNACMYYWRKRRHEAPLLAEHEERADFSTEEGLEKWTLQLSVAATLARLGSRCRETLRRYYLGEEKPADIAVGLDTSKAYVFQLLSTCRKIARKIFRDLTEPKR